MNYILFEIIVFLFRCWFIVLGYIACVLIVKEIRKMLKRRNDETTRH